MTASPPRGATVLVFGLLAALGIAGAAGLVGARAQATPAEGRYRLYETSAAGILVLDTETGALSSFSNRDTGNAAKPEDWARGLIKRRELK